MPRPAAPRRVARPRRLAVALLAGAAGSVGLAGCGATGANLAAGGGNETPWYSPAGLLAKADPARAVGLTDDPIPATRNELKNPAALDLAYANLRGQAAGGGADDAETAYRRVLKKDPKNVEALIGLARLIETNAGDRPNELADAQDAYERAAAAAPGDARTHNALGRFHAARGRWGDSAAAFGRAASVAANTRQSREASFGLAVATARGGDLAAARPHFVAAVGEASAHYNVGTLLLRAGDRDAAEAEFRQAVLKDPGDNPELKKAHAALAALTEGRRSPLLAAAGQPAATGPAVTPAAATAIAAAPPTVTAAFNAPAAVPATAAPAAAAVPTFTPAPPVAARATAPEPGSEVPPPWPF